jgi:phenylalanine-4-hydroxylase
MLAKRMYREQLEMGLVDTRDLGAKIVASLLIEEPFKPVFKLEDKSVRLQRFDITQGKLIARFVPAE